MLASADSRRAALGLLRRLTTGSFVYTVTAVLQRGIMLFLLPLYTRYLTPSDYGILAVVIGLQQIAVVVVSLAIPSAMTRYYFEYRHQPEKLKEFWGATLLFVILASVAGSALLLLAGPFFLGPLLGEISFWPYAALGLAAVMFQPVVTTFLTLLQTKEQPLRFAWHSTSQVLLNIALVVSFVVVLRQGAFGALAATLVSMAVYFVVALVAFRAEYRLCWRPQYLALALRYSLPIVPHTVAGQLQAVVDRVLLNKMISTSVSGLYSVGFMFASIMIYITDSVNRAYLPIAMGVLKKRADAELAELKNLGLLLVVGYALLALALSLFARDLVALFTTAAYHESFVVIPILAFGFVLGGIYMLLVNILFYEPAAVKYVPVGTLLGAGSGILLNLLLIPWMGMLGAAVASLLANLTVLVVIGAIAHRFQPVRWPYERFALLFTVAFLPAVLAPRLFAEASWAMLPLKIVLLAAVAIALSLIAWGDPWRLPRMLKALRAAYGEAPHLRPAGPLNPSQTLTATTGPQTAAPSPAPGSEKV
jgi:O-antigen/teichoic acid export membrane protein